MCVFIFGTTKKLVKYLFFKVLLVLQFETHIE